MSDPIPTICPFSMAMLWCIAKSLSTEYIFALAIIKSAFFFCVHDMVITLIRIVTEIILQLVNMSLACFVD